MSTDSESAVVAALADVWDSMLRLGAGLDEDQWKLPTDCPGWSVQDNLAHILGIESVILGRPEPADMESPSAQLALSRLRGILGVIVGSRLRPPDGTRVAFVVEGPGGFVDAFAMQDGRAVAMEPVPSPLGDAVDAALHMDADT